MNGSLRGWAGWRWWERGGAWFGRDGGDVVVVADAGRSITEMAYGMGKLSDAAQKQIRDRQDQQRPIQTGFPNFFDLLFRRMIHGAMGFGATILRDSKRLMRDLARKLGNLLPQTSRDLGDACHTLSSQVRSGTPLPDALRAAAMPHLGSRLIKSLSDTENRVEHGASLSDAARSSNLPRRISELSGLARDADSLADGFAMLGRWYDQAANDRTSVLVRVLPVVATALIAAIVFPVIYGVIDTMIILMDGAVYEKYKW